MTETLEPCCQHNGRLFCLCWDGERYRRILYVRRMWRLAWRAARLARTAR